MSVLSINNGSAGSPPASAPAVVAGTGQVASGQPAVQAPPAQPSPKQLAAAVEQIQKTVARSTTAQNLQFSIDKDTNKTVVRVIDSETGELVRQIPSEEVMAIARSIDSMRSLLLDHKA